MFFTAIRIPEILHSGRFWAEEGQIFFVNAIGRSWQDALFFSYGGYLNLAANLAGYLAFHLVSLKYAPYVTSIFALIIQSCPATLICFCMRSNPVSKFFPAVDSWLQSRLALIGALLIVLTLPASQEVWLSSIGSQVHLNLCVALILVLGSGGIWYRSFQKVLLVLAPLSGPGGSFLIPFFYLRALLDQSKDRLIQAGILTACCAAQLVFFWRPQERCLGINPLLFINVWFVKHLLIPFKGLYASDVFAGFLRIDWANHIVSMPIVVGMIVAYISWIAILCKEKKAAPIWFFLTGTVLATLAYVGALGEKVDLLLAQPGYRYAFPPQIMFELSFLSMAFSTKGVVQNISRALCIWLLVIALNEFFVTPPLFKTGVPWRVELRKWEKDPSYKPQVWPPQWHVDLSGVAR